MFFIGIFGIDQAQKNIGTYNNAICPACGALTRFEVFRVYSYFHVFFIPTFRWNNRYLVKSSCCGSVYELDPDIGSQYEKGFSPEINDQHLRPLAGYPVFHVCPGCGARIESYFKFCPFCGKKIT